MKIFETIRKETVILGISPIEAHQFDWKIVMGFLIFSLNIFLFLMFILTKENPILMDYVLHFCTITSLTEMSICLMAIVLQHMKLFEFIEIIEKLINERN